MAKVVGAQKFAARLSRAGNAQQLIGKAVYAASDMVRAEAKRLIVAGAVQGRGHVPSLPGEPPNRDTGTLDTMIVNAKVGPMKAEVTSEAPYAAALETGTSKMEARPYMTPATENKREEATGLVRKAIRKAIQG